MAVNRSTTNARSFPWFQRQRRLADSIDKRATYQRAGAQVLGPRSCERKHTRLLSTSVEISLELCISVALPPTTSNYWQHVVRTSLCHRFLPLSSPTIPRLISTFSRSLSWNTRSSKDQKSYGGIVFHSSELRCLETRSSSSHKTVERVMEHRWFFVRTVICTNWLEDILWRKMRRQWGVTKLRGRVGSWENRVGKLAKCARIPLIPRWKGSR